MQKNLNVLFNDALSTFYNYLASRTEMYLHGKIVHSLCNGSLDQSFMSYFSFQPVLHGWYNIACGMCYSVCGMVHIKEPFLLIGKSSPCGGSRFSLPYVQRNITVTKCVECIVK